MLSQKLYHLASTIERLPHWKCSLTAHFARRNGKALCFSTLEKDVGVFEKAHKLSVRDSVATANVWAYRGNLSENGLCISPLLTSVNHIGNGSLRYTHALFMRCNYSQKSNAPDEAEEGGTIVKDEGNVRKKEKRLAKSRKLSLEIPIGRRKDRHGKGLSKSVVDGQRGHKKGIRKSAAVPQGLPDSTETLLDGGKSTAKTEKDTEAEAEAEPPIPPKSTAALGRRSLKPSFQKPEIRVYLTNADNQGIMLGVENETLLTSSDDTNLPNANRGNGSSSLPSLFSELPLFPKLFALPLYRKPAFPGFYQILQIQDQEVLDFLIELKRRHGQSYIGGFLVKQEVEEEDTVSLAALRKDAGRISHWEEMHEYGAVLHLLNFSAHGHIRGGQVIVMPHKRVRMTGLSDTQTSDSPLFNVNVDYMQDELTRFDANDIYKALHLEIISTMKDLLKTSFFYKEHFDQVVRFYNLDYPHKLADLVAGMSLAKRDELQAVLAEPDVEKRLRLVLEIAKKDLEFAKLQVQVKNQVEEKATKEQRKYMLMEQLKFIKRELGLEKDDRQSIVQTFQDNLDKKRALMSAEVISVIEYELSRIASLEQSSAEFNICRSYLEWLTGLPWDSQTVDNKDIHEAETVLNKDHYGLKDVKDRILEFIAVSVLKEDTQGKIMCLVGPPGVGKTSVGKSIARALGRSFYQFSLGGLSDVAELRGHRRTYVGAMPGKLVQALKHTQVSNPVILLDEIDKLGRDIRGDPASALLEILDPNQNTSFRDHYLDVPIDLSKTLFVCTANTPDTIPAPLLDRLEIIRIAGYIFEEKLKIAEQYLIPQTEASTGVKSTQIQCSDEVLPMLVHDYSREAGVRNLLKLIEKMYRKVALQIVRGESSVVSITSQNLPKFVGQPQFFSERLYDLTPPGVVMGLAWTQLGGATLYVEAIGRILPAATFANSAQMNKTIPTQEQSNLQDSVEPPKNDYPMGSFKVTGHLGSVMSESSQIALTFSKNFVKKVQPTNHYLDQAHIHLHVPEGATPKDGPSAGVTMASSLVSLALNQSVGKDIAMTGELTLTGKVLKIGGVKEKVIAAKRESANILIFPASNYKDIDELDSYIKEGLSIHFAETYDDVFKIAFKEF